MCLRYKSTKIIFPRLSPHRSCQDCDFTRTTHSNLKLFIVIVQSEETEGQQTAIKWQSIQNTILMHYERLVVENDI